MSLNLFISGMSLMLSMIISNTSILLQIFLFMIGLGFFIREIVDTSTK